MTCVAFGEQVLSHPLLVDAAETSFLPVAIYNNKAGADAEILERYGEPAWNNPVVRFLAQDGKDLIPRRDRIYATHELGARMEAALAAGGFAVPPYLRAAVASAAPETSAALFTMHCYWQGEAELGGLEGVVATRAVFYGSAEAVEVRYDRRALSLVDLVDAAFGAKCAERVYLEEPADLDAARARAGDRVYARTEEARAAPAPDQKYHLRRSRTSFVPIAETQAARINAAIARGESGHSWLGPRQCRLADRLAELERKTPKGLSELEVLPALSRFDEVERRVDALLRSE